MVKCKAARCEACRKKLNAMMIIVNKCRCGGIYCVTHLHDHDCTFDYNKSFREKMSKELPKIEAPKIESI